MKHWKLGLAFLSAFALTWTPAASIVPGFAPLEAFATTVDISTATVELDPETAEYTGKTIDHPTVTVKLGDEAIPAGDNYSVDWTTTDYKGHGDKTITLTGLDGGKFTRDTTTTATFTIEASKITASDITVGSVTYDPNVKTNSDFVDAVKAGLVVKRGDDTVASGDYDVTMDNKDSNDVMSAGTHTVHVKMKSDKDLKDEVDKVFGVEQLDLSGSDIDISITPPSATYDGEIVEPTVEVKATRSATTPIPEEEYTVSYLKDGKTVSEIKDAGTYTVKITGNKKNCIGTNSVSFVVSAGELNRNLMGITLSEETSAYTGKAQKPDITVTYNGKTLATDDYTAIWNNNNDMIAVGQYNVAVSIDNGNMSGSKTFSDAYKIVKADIKDADVSLEYSSITYDGGDKEPAVTVEFGGAELTEGTDYTVVYKNNRSVGTATATITGCGESFKGSLEKTFEIKAVDFNDATITLEKTETEYNGEGQAPGVTVKIGDNEVDEALYKVTYTNAKGNTIAAAEVKDAGAYTITVEPKNSSNANVTGSKGATFTITPLDLSKKGKIAAIAAHAIDADDVTNNIVAVKEEPAVTATGIGGNLIKDTDFEYSYANNDKAGTATVTVTGKDNYTGSVSKNFEITGANWELTITGIVDAVYTGSPVTFTDLKVYDATLKRFLTEDTDYTVKYEYNTAVSTDAKKAKITFTAMGAYKSTLTEPKTFSITAAKLTADMITVADATYSGAALEPEIKVALGDTTLTKDTDYTVAFADNTNAGTAKVTVTLTGKNTNVTGDPVTKEFTIGKAAQTITASNQTKTFGAKAFALGAKLTAGDGKLTYKSNKTSVAKVSSAGKITIKGAGTAKITVTAKATDNYEAATKTITVKVNKAANPMTVKAKTATVKLTALSKKNQTLAVGKVLTVKKNKGTVTYTKKSGNKNITIAKNGKVTVKKGLKAGTYSIKVNVKAAGNANYKAATKTVTFKVVVK